MPHYFFHLQNDAYITDDEGLEFPDLEAARTEAVANVLELAAADVKGKGRVSLHHRIDIADEAGDVVASISFRDALTIED